MATRADLRGMVRGVLADTTAWPDADLNAWIGGALLDYSGRFPYRLTDEVAGSLFSPVRTYSLQAYSDPQGLNIYRVEYPAYRNPPEYLTRLSESHPGFYGGRYFDIRESSPRLLVLGVQPQASEYVLLHLEISHPDPGDDVTALTVPEPHLEALKLYVIWQALERLEAAEAGSPDLTAAYSLLNSLRLSAGEAREAYLAQLEAYIQAVVAGGYSGPWSMDHRDRVY